MLFYVGCIIMGYLLGSVSFSVILARWKFKSDVREHGSGNAGATNMARSYGMDAGIATLLGDMAKTALAAFIGSRLSGEVGLLLACAACLIGHCWPLYFGFQGGKGVSVFACIALLLDWKAFLILMICFVLLVYLFRYISIGSIVCAGLFPVAYLLVGNSIDSGFFLSCTAALLIIYRHRMNIKRLLKGEESKFTPKWHS